MTNKTQPTAHAEITAPISADLRRLPALSEQDAELLEQAASMLEGLQNDERNRGNCSTAEGAACSAHAVRRLAVQLLRAAPPAPAAVAVLTTQQIIDRFDFLEGAVTESAYRRIVETAQSIQLAAAPAQAVAVAELDMDRVLSIADVHAEESREDGTRLLDHGGLVAFAKDVLRVAAPAQEHATQLAGQAAPIALSAEVRAFLREAINDATQGEDADMNVDFAEELGRLLDPIYAAAPEKAQDCTRSHPHENMSPMCVLRTEIARLNHAAAVAEAKGDERTDALQDSAYAAGMLSGWNLCVADDHATFSKVRGERITGAARVANAARAAAPVAHPHHCTARSADGACEECEGHTQAMAEWRAEAAAPAQAQEDARDLEAEALRACRDLPEDWEIEIHLERGYGVVTVIDPQGNDDELPAEGTLFDALKESIDTAIRDDAARAAQGGDKP